MNQKRLIQGIWGGIAVLLAGTIVDQRWHATHEEFEAASDQLQAHWLLWLGALVLLVVSALAVRQPRRENRNRGYRTLLASGIAYATVSVWHYIEHASGSDPAVAHVLLVITWAGMLAGAAVATVSARRIVSARHGTTHTEERVEKPL